MMNKVRVDIKVKSTKKKIISNRKRSIRNNQIK